MDVLLIEKCPEGEDHSQGAKGVSSSLGWEPGRIAVGGQGGASTPQQWFFVTPQSLLHPFFFPRNTLISQMGKLRLRDTPEAPLPRNGRTGMGAQTRGDCNKQGRSSPLHQGPADLASFFNSELSQNPRLGVGGQG